MSDRPANGVAADLYCEISGLPARVVPSDLTRAGIFVQTTSPPDADGEVEIFLRSSAGEITAQAHVVHVVDAEVAAREGRSPGFGALFTHLSDEARAWIDRTLQSSRAPVVSRMAPRAPSAHPAKDANASEQEITDAIRDLERRLRDLRVQPAWGVLGVPRDTDEKAAHAAYLEASRRYHPHRFARYDSEAIARLATELFILHQQAYRTISKALQSSKRSEARVVEDPHTRATLDFPLAQAGDPSLRRSKPPTPAAAVVGRIETHTPHRAVPAPQIIERLSRRTPGEPVPAPSISTRTPGEPLPAPFVSTRTPPVAIPAPSPPERIPARTPAVAVPAPEVAARVSVRTPAHSVPAPAEAPRARRRPATPLPDEVNADDDSERPTRETLDRRIAEAELAVAAGMKHVALGRIAEATATFGQALAHDPSNEQAQIWLLVCQARTLEAQGKADLSRARYEAVLALDPKHREALRKTGRDAERPTLRRKRRWFGSDSSR